VSASDSAGLAGRGGGRATELLGRVPAWTITALLAIVYLILAPQSPDLAAASYRSDLFSRVGFSLWDNSWYGGHHLPAYSILAPALGALIGPQPLAAIAMVLATALFALCIAGRFPPAAVRIAAAWFAIGAGIALLSSRVPFDLGLAIALGAVLLAQRRRTAAALLVSVVASLASPVAGAFLAMAMLAWAITATESRDRLRATLLTLAALAPIAALTVVFPEGGSQPFVGSAFYPALAGVLVVGLAVPPQQRTLRVGVGIYALVLIGCFLVPSAVGGNADRLGALATGPVAACALFGTSASWRRWALLALAAPLLYWQANAPVTDFVSTVGNRGVERSYYAPLIAELGRLDVGYGHAPARIEVVPTVDHWEARYLAPAVMLARGWERQLDRYRNGLFYGSAAPTPAVYRAWLSAQAISYIALPDASLDYSGKAEARLLGEPAVSGAGGYLREVRGSAHWRLFAVRDPAPLASSPGRLTQAGSEDFTLLAPAPGTYTVRLRFTPYWALSRGSGCVAQAPGGWTQVRAKRAGALHAAIRFSLSRVLDHGARCD
jgi:MFS family permease